MAEYKVFWRILFDVIGGVPRLRKEVTLWDHINLSRLGRTVVNLDCSPSETGAVNFLNDRVSFAPGGYLICTDMPADLTPWIEAYNLAGLSETNLGENIAISAEVELLEPQFNSDMYPIFYYPQDENGNYLALYVREDTARSIHWVIEGQRYEEGSYSIAGDDYWHRVRVRQDQGSDGANYFEFLVDSMHFFNRPKTNPSDGRFHFSSESKTFYIGRAPDPDDAEQWLYLGGVLGHLEFDPNDSCMSCGG